MTASFRISSPVRPPYVVVYLLQLLRADLDPVVLKVEQQRPLVREDVALDVKVVLPEDRAVDLAHLPEPPQEHPLGPRLLLPRAPSEPCLVRALPLSGAPLPLDGLDPPVDLPLLLDRVDRPALYHVPYVVPGYGLLRVLEGAVAYPYRGLPSAHDVARDPLCKLYAHDFTT